MFSVLCFGCLIAASLACNNGDDALATGSGSAAGGTLPLGTGYCTSKDEAGCGSTTGACDDVGGCNGRWGPSAAATARRFKAQVPLALTGHGPSTAPARVGSIATPATSFASAR
ncbi:MAG: hypothetical protein SGI86_07815 [Deltaproteobacteria bacterium]|nr:hypothetical protein [Deltaproteobacteria bacterium]